MNAPLHILYRDEWLVAVDKPAGQLVHPADHPQEGDMVTMKILRDQLGQRVYNIHRIDRPTTGVLLFGTDRNAARTLHRALERHQLRKTYWAVSHGLAPESPWQCREPLQKSESATPQEAHTSFRRLDFRAPDCLRSVTPPHLSLIEATPHTGRFHQIRKHLLHARLPIVGDYRYAGVERSDTLGSLLHTGTRMLLQSRQLTFTHPVTGKNTTIQAPADPSFKACFPRLA